MSTTNIATITERDFPDGLKKFIMQLDLPGITVIPSLEERLKKPIQRQWYEKVVNGQEIGKARLTRELRELELYCPYSALLITKTPSKSAIVRGAIMNKPLIMKGELCILSYSFVVWFPPSYPHNFPLVWFCTNRKITTGQNMGPPYRVYDSDFVNRGRHFHTDGTACICELDAIASRAGKSGWKPEVHDIRTFIGWIIRYLANYEIFCQKGIWPDDQ